jgi:hypothetical protein
MTCPSKKIQGRSCRRKGARWERELVKLFQTCMPDAEIRRGLQYRSGQEVPDVDCPIFWIEAKRGRKPNIRNALQQAVTAAPDGRIPLAVIRDDRSEPITALLLDDFLELIEEWWRDKQR